MDRSLSSAHDARVMLPLGSDSHQQCESCGAEWPELHAAPQCAACGGLLVIRHAPPVNARGEQMSGAELQHAFAQHCCARPQGHASGVWRFEQVVMPTAGDAIVSWPEGNTALVQRKSIAQYVGVDAVWCKHEGMNPTGSFKDRGMTVGTTQAVRVGATAVACASTGNTSASLAAYAAHAGLPALVFVPAGQVALGKLTQTLAYGARTLLVRGDFDDCLRLVQESAQELGIYLLNSINPWRLEGQKTIVFELLQQLGWDAPEWIVLPAGNLGNTAAFGKALREAHALGLINRVPRIASVQAAGSAPFAQSFADGFRSRTRVQAETLATAIRIGDPASHNRAVEAITFSNGVVLSVTDEEIVAAKRVIDAAGVGCEPASAASVAGARALVQRGVINAGDRVVTILTGHVLKDPGILVRMHQDAAFDDAPANTPIEIDANVAAVARVLREHPAHFSSTSPT
jgi:threonine synthase